MNGKASSLLRVERTGSEKAKKRFPSKKGNRLIAWRRGWDSNPRGIAPKLISSQPRYDRFDTSPYLSSTSALKIRLGKRRELMERTANIYLFRIPQNPSKIKVFQLLASR